MAGLGSLLGEGSNASQFLLWGVAYGFAQALLQPEFEALQQLIWRNQTVKVLSPADLADMVIRGILTEDQGAAEAADSGIDGDRFHNMVLDTGEPPGLEFVLEAWRRQYIGEGSGAPGEASVRAAILTSRLRPEWTDTILKMALVPISVADAVNAVLRGQIPHDQGQTIAFENGINADGFQVLLNTAGRPPSPTELVEFLRRGFIPRKGTGPDALTFQQGIFEGDSKDKWEPLYERLAEYLPPPRTITALERAGAITPAQAVNLYQQQGLSPDLAAAYSKTASHEKLAGTKQLAEGVVLALYEGQAITEADASTHLAGLGYAPDDVAVLLRYTDLKREYQVLQSAETRIGTEYINHRISRVDAATMLGHLEAHPDRIAYLLTVWDAERAANVKTLTAAQVASAFVYEVFTQDEAMAYIVGLGYTPLDAWVILSDRSHNKLPGRPAAGPAGPGQLP